MLHLAKCSLGIFAEPKRGCCAGSVFLSTFRRFGVIKQPPGGARLYRDDAAVPLGHVDHQGGRRRHLRGCQMTILRLYAFGPSGFWTMAPLSYAAKYDPFLSLDCAPTATPSTLVQSKQRKGSIFAIWQACLGGRRRCRGYCRCLVAAPLTLEGAELHGILDVGPARVITMVITQVLVLLNQDMWMSKLDLAWNRSFITKFCEIFSKSNLVESEGTPFRVEVEDLEK